MKGLVLRATVAAVAFSCILALAGASKEASLVVVALGARLGQRELALPHPPADHRPAETTVTVLHCPLNMQVRHLKVSDFEDVVGDDKVHFIKVRVA